ncbi:urea transport protein Utp [Heterostelium album PN500]|uniref:Urea transport protein Utp n=1 Tax=Heterostelium pallidum (strain ATCC 26659 / Pp 5 / PN500) TaxID=670386 RepID=D3AY48_HETP5|nr:urea transport protein Utp [Heterostelium album PN500]EFA85875.1 urea transport protein Utp [Heterostelium album PN500]|eukprot:XP_020437981.1 urea transport protein Utp [Heterostelium album PN500]
MPLESNAITGIFFLVAMFYGNPEMTYIMIVAVVISNAELAVINAGLFSFNAVLSGIASAGNDVADGLYMLVTVGVATIFYIFLASKNFTTLTFPFVTSMWALAIWKRLILGQLVPKIPKKIEQYLDNNNQKKMMMHHKFNNHANNGDPLNNKLNSSNNNNNNCGNNDLCGVGGDHKSINNEIEIYVELQPIETNTPPPLAVHHHHHHNQQQDKVNNNQTITAKQQQEKEKESKVIYNTLKIFFKNANIVGF